MQGRRPSPGGRTRLLLGAVLVVALLAMAGCSYSAPGVCRTCGGFDDAVYEHDLNVTVERTELAIDLRADGSARWTARVELSGPDVSRLRDDPDLRGAVVEEARRLGDGVGPDDPADLSHRMDGDAVVASYTVPDVADRRGDVLVVDYFYDPGDPTGSPNYYDVRADRIVLRGPEGSAVAKTPPGATDHGDALVWAGRYGTVVWDRYPAFALDGSADPVETEVAIARQVAGWAARPTATFAVLAGVALLVLVDALLWVVLDGRSPATLRVPERLAGGLPTPEGAARRSDAGNYPLDLTAVVAARLPEWPTLAALAAVGVALLAVATNGWIRGMALWGFTLPVVPVVLLGALGVSSARGRRLERPLAVLLVGSPLVGGLAYVLTTGPSDGATMAVLWLAVVAATGVPAFGVFHWVAARLGTSGAGGLRSA